MLLLIPKNGHRIRAKNGWKQIPIHLERIAYADGHVWVYDKKLTKLYRRFLSLQRLRLRATMNYWVNDAIGRLFFLVEKPVAPGLTKTFEIDIVPRMFDDVVKLPSDCQLKDNPYLCRFFMILARKA